MAFPVPRGHLSSPLPFPPPLPPLPLPSLPPPPLSSLQVGGRQEEGETPDGPPDLVYDFTSFYQKGSWGLFLALCILKAFKSTPAPLTHPFTVSFSSQSSRKAVPNI